MTPDDVRHGSQAGYLAHHRDGEPACPACQRAAARYEQARLLDKLSGRPRLLPARGTQRRLQALAAIGHSFARMAVPLGIGPTSVWPLACQERPMVFSSTAARVAALYDAWSMLLPPDATPADRRAASYARTVARKRGWAPPLAWDDIDHDPTPATPGHDSDVDPVVVERILAGDMVSTTTAERRAVVAAWPTSGRSYADLARLTGWKVERYFDTPREDTAA